MHSRIQAITQRVIARSRPTRTAYLAQMREAAEKGPRRGSLPCANQAHGMAGCSQADKQRLRLPGETSVAIVSAYNDVLSADRKSTRLNSRHVKISYAVFRLKKKMNTSNERIQKEDSHMRQD